MPVAAYIILAICCVHHASSQCIRIGPGPPCGFKPTTKKPTNRPTRRPTGPTPPPSPFARHSLLKTGDVCGGGPGPCIPNCDAACSASNTSPYTCPSWRYDDFGNNNKCQCGGCTYQCDNSELAKAQYDVDECKIDTSIDLEDDDNIGPAVAELFYDLATSATGNIPKYGPYISAGMDFSKGIFQLVHDQNSGSNPLQDSIQKHTAKNNKHMIKCMDQKITGVVSDNVKDIMQEAGYYYRVAAVYEVEASENCNLPCSGGRKLTELKSAWKSFGSAIDSKFDNVGPSAQYYKDLLLPLQDFVKAYELLSLDHLTYMHALDTAENYQNNFALTINAAQKLLAWIKKAREMIVDKEMRPRLYQLPCANGVEMEQWITEWENQFDADNVEPILKFMGDLHHLNRILDFTMPPLSCRIDVTGTYSNGAYFNFDYKQVDALLGRTDWHNEKFDANGRKIVIWRQQKIDGVLKNFGRGRYDPFESKRNGDWNTGDTINVLGMCEQKCTLEVQSADHRNTNGGKYFNFDITELDAILGRTTWHGEKLKVGNDKTVIVWRNPNGGSKGDAHGRYDPFGTAKDGDWAVGDKITFADCQNY